MSLPPNAFRYPPVVDDSAPLTGVFPVDFVLETVLRAGLEWFRTDPKAPMSVFGHMTAPWLSVKYGEAKVIEIGNYIKKYEIRIVQHFALIDPQLPSISIQLLDGNEMTERASLSDHARVVDVMNSDGEVEGRSEIGYAAVMDNIHIGIHNIGTPDLTKYLYYLVVYILKVFKPQLEERGLMLGTFRATDISRLNDYLPENMFSRFVNFSVFTIAPFRKGDVPIIDTFLGVHVAPGPDVIFNENSDEELNIETGVTVDER